MDKPETTQPAAMARRTWLRGAAATASVAVLSCSRQVDAQAASPLEKRAPEKNAGAPVAVQPLPFDAARLDGLSERLIVSHHDNNYAGAVGNLNSVEQDLSELPADAPGYLVAALQSKRLAFENSVILHEAYFANLGGTGELGPKTREAITRQFETMSAFESRFTGVGKSLAGGSGWALLTYHLHRKRLSIDIASDHSQTCANAIVLLALDMYEHSYHMDYGTQADRYIDAFMKNISGEVIEERLERALAMAAGGRDDSDVPAVPDR